MTISVTVKCLISIIQVTATKTFRNQQTPSTLFATFFLNTLTAHLPVAINREHCIQVYEALNLLNVLGKELKCEACQAFISFFNVHDKFRKRSTNESFYLSYENKITLEILFCC